MRRITGLALTLLTATSSLFGQRGHPSGLREVRDGGSLGLTLVVAQPLGEFRRTGDVAAGLTGFAVVGRSSGLGLRIDGQYMVYDSDYRGYGISTTSSIGSLALGPQVTLGQGPIRPYGFATAGGSMFWSSVSDANYCGCYDSDVFVLNGRFTTVTQLGAGLLINLSRRRTGIALDLGVRDVRHDRVRYVPAGGITENSDGSFTVQRVETPVRMLVYQIGVSFAIR
jgi:hypothetical protein